MAGMFFKGAKINLMKTIKNRLSQMDKKEVVKLIGYYKGLKTLDEFLNSKDIFHWIHKGKYDFENTSKEFFIKLCKILNISDEEVGKELNYIEAKENELRKFEGVYLFVNTNFKNTQEPIFVLAFMKAKRRIYPNLEDLIFKSDEEVFKIISQIIKIHYKENKGLLPMWGEIINYVYHHIDGKIYVFDFNGNLVENGEYIESKAVLCVGNKKLFEG